MTAPDPSTAEYLEPPFRLLVVLSFDIPNADVVTEILTAIDPPKLPYFAGAARIAVDPVSTQIEKWLDE